ncbi:hypothetical protein [Aquimarina sp. 2201CG14-23]|uniref:hypothetical protein n=1 Tax=Aquimarina mycalae TaxID=3040073 RepID=UPI002477E53D|nr:hypothetical protein [Aquimarina sp. 2201CG14-23]MDH7447744.1 hypothetical protein [Aquimarina sp. 2201CG14-23]
MDLYPIIQNSIQFLSDNWKEQYADFLQEEHLGMFAKNLEQYHEFGVPDTHPLPYFDEEITPSLSKAFENFEVVLSNQNTPLQDWAKSIERVPFQYLLMLIGQRWTSATLKNETAIPPLKKTLLDSCFAPFNDQICIATRAWEKHIGRSADDFWGEMKGNPSQKEEKVRKRILEIIDHKTWWNIFYHYKHEFVYEIRVPSGHGIRWNSKGTKLIGFLEPFL